MNYRHLYQQEQRFQELLLHAAYQDLDPSRWIDSQTESPPANKQTILDSPIPVSDPTNTLYIRWTPSETKPVSGNPTDSTNAQKSKQSNDPSQLQGISVRSQALGGRYMNDSYIISLNDSIERYNQLAETFQSGDIIMGIAHNTDLKNLAIFLGSVRAASSDIEVILFINEDSKLIGKTIP